MDDVLAARLRCMMTAEELVSKNMQAYGVEDILATADILFEWLTQDHTIGSEDEEDEEVH